MTTWSNRIVEAGEVAPKALVANPRNWRVHPKSQAAAVTDVLERVGWVSGVIVNRRTGLIVDGHLRVSVALERGEPSIPVQYVDLDEAEEALILASLDAVGAMATADAAAVGELLAGIDAGDGPIGQLLAEMESMAGQSIVREPNPQRQMGDKSKTVRVVVYCDELAVVEAAIRAAGISNRGGGRRCGGRRAGPRRWCPARCWPATVPARWRRARGAS